MVGIGVANYYFSLIVSILRCDKGYVPSLSAAVHGPRPIKWSRWVLCTRETARIPKALPSKQNNERVLEWDDRNSVRCQLLCVAEFTRIPVNYCPVWLLLWPSVLAISLYYHWQQLRILSASHSVTRNWSRRLHFRICVSFSLPSNHVGFHLHGVWTTRNKFAVLLLLLF